jgi:hypothetical protein
MPVFLINRPVSLNNLVFPIFQLSLSPKPFSVDTLKRRVSCDFVMPDWYTISNPESPGNVLAPGVIGLFVQGIETGLVFCKLSMWLSLPEHTESLYISVMTGFVTILGLWALFIFCMLCPPDRMQRVQTGICFASAWRIYVKDFGQPVRGLFHHLTPYSCDVLDILGGRRLD